jgi:predicted metal-dependent hydrolase
LSASVPAPVLSAEEQAAFEKGVREFNEGLFFECHDTLEELWAGVRGPGRDFFQGLIQVAVGFYHLGNSNPAGAERLLGRALRRLEGYPAQYGGLELEELRQAVAARRDALRAAPPTGPPRGPAPRLRFVSASTSPDANRR